jgi:peroxiredoxin
MNTIKRNKCTLVLALVYTLLLSLHQQNALAVATMPIYPGVDTDTTITVSGVPLMPQDISPLLIGENIPMATLPNADGNLFDLNTLVSQKPTILVFYRGGWCPYCSKQLAGLQEIEQDLRNRGYQIIAVSTDSPENLKQTKNKQQLTYTLLSDADLALSKKVGIAYKSPRSYDKFLPETSGGKNMDKLLPVPSVFILNKKGTILFEYINPDITQRLSANLLKAAATSLLKEI